MESFFENLKLDYMITGIKVRDLTNSRFYINQRNGLIINNMYQKK